MTISDLKALLEMGFPALITIAYAALWIQYIKLQKTALSYAERCGPPCRDCEEKEGSGENQDAPTRKT